MLQGIMQGTRMSSKKRICKECERLLVLSKKNFRYHKGAYSKTCKECLREYNRQYYRRKIKPVLKKPVTSRELRVRELIKKYEKIFRKLKRLEIEPNTTEYTAEQIDEVLIYGKKA